MNTRKKIIDKIGEFRAVGQYLDNCDILFPVWCLYRCYDEDKDGNKKTPSDIIQHHSDALRCLNDIKNALDKVCTQIESLSVDMNSRLEVFMEDYYGGDNDGDND